MNNNEMFINHISEIKFIPYMQTGSSDTSHCVTINGVIKFEAGDNEVKITTSTFNTIKKGFCGDILVQYTVSEITNAKNKGLYYECYHDYILFNTEIYLDAYNTPEYTMIFKR